VRCCTEDARCETTVKGNDISGWSSDGVMFWLGRMQNRDAIEWWGECPRLRSPFYNNVEYESGDPERVADGGGADLMLHF
jgi:hypothetical protein